MAALRLLYLLPMLLGRTFDAEKSRVGVDIFSSEDVKKAATIDSPFYHSVYKMVRNSKEVEDFLEISGDLSLKIKSGMITVQGKGSYLKSYTSSNNAAEVLLRATFQTASLVLPHKIQPMKYWMAYDKEYLGTHYVRSITYGGELIASIKFVALNESNVEDIRGSVSGSLTTGSIQELVVQGKLDKLQSDLKGKAKMEIKYYGTVPLDIVPSSVQGLYDTFDGFQEQVKKVNNGLGVPVYAELADLSDLNNTYSRFQISGLKFVFDQLSDFLEDVKASQDLLNEWIKSLPSSLSGSDEIQIEAFSKRLEKVSEILYDVIGNFKIDEAMTNLQRAKDAYNEGQAFSLPGKFIRALKTLKKKIVIRDVHEEIGSSVYIRWGKDSCHDNAETLYSGVASSSRDGNHGGGSNYQCLPDNPHFDHQPLVNGSRSVISGLRYSIMDINPFEDVYGNAVACSVCSVQGRTSVDMISASDICPEGWYNEYEGFLMAGRPDGPRGQFVCVDKKPSAVETGQSRREDESLRVVVAKSGVLPVDNFKDNSVVPCVVCSK